MKVRISIPGSYVAMELKEDHAAAIFKDLSAKLLGIEPAGKVWMQPRIKCADEEAHEIVQMMQEQQKALHTMSDDCCEKKVSIPAISDEDEISSDNDRPVERETEAAASSDKGYKGFLHICCESCGRTRTFCAKESLTVHRCSCGHETPLKDLMPIWSQCECGRRSKYMTNLDEFAFDINCVCGVPVAVKWNARKRLYETIKD